ncbi:hypothetical protein M409DRAFT_68460 [Zasmidium cellare ATCC 36951]|uniref:Uncharacterized protein n=1 Tax=Zasmidium cellare ATCC 36951 TaxID=1080233 RepID=A0A6A6C936_ZASCE|nr:uncharacterized protein M409DRAFT_68460 [Zasmidium cellare ATCC 36951]KAF2163551.1 hypothetical protein M409DRAFT_68460 [Zasmidium cellare ATCC 36951]
MISAILLVIIAIFLPPVAVYIVAGCGADLLINIALTILGYFPGHIHAFYVLYVYYNRKEQVQQGYYDDRPAPGVYSQNVQTGGQGYGTMGAH